MGSSPTLGIILSVSESCQHTFGVTVGYDHSRRTTMSGEGVTVLVVVPVVLLCAFWTLCSYYNVRRKRARRWDPANLPQFSHELNTRETPRAPPG